MFTGIVAGLYPVVEIRQKDRLLQYAVSLDDALLKDLDIGRSISVQGVCQTVVKISAPWVWFDAVEETLKKTTLGNLKKGDEVNIERAARIGDEIGGHFLSGHVIDVVQILEKEMNEGYCRVLFRCNPSWMRYLFSKGFIALDGISLTLVDVDLAGTFSVHLIPETLRVTSLGRKTKGDWVNLEVDSQTQVIVDTIERRNLK